MARPMKTHPYQATEAKTAHQNRMAHRDIPLATRLVEYGKGENCFSLQIICAGTASCGLFSYGLVVSVEWIAIDYLSAKGSLLPFAEFRRQESRNRRARTTAMRTKRPFAAGAALAARYGHSAQLTDFAKSMRSGMAGA